MFIQVIEGKTKDPDALHRRLEVWERDLMPGAIGYLGSTGGCTSNKDFFLVARFESRESAQQNSDRPEQGAWWAETQKCLEGDVTFHESEDVQIMEHGNMDAAHFVQVMDGHVKDHDTAIAIEREAEPMLTDLRPDLLGVMTAYYDDDAYTEVAYFTSEADARRAESQGLPDEAKAILAKREKVMPVDRYLDITEPWLTTTG